MIIATLCEYYARNDIVKIYIAYILVEESVFLLLLQFTPVY